MVDSVLSVGLQGVQNGLATTRQAAQDIASATIVGSAKGSPADTDATADITAAVVDLKVGEHQVKASAAVIKTADEMMGTLIDIKA